MKKKLVIAIVIGILVFSAFAEILAYGCFTCPQCGKMGDEIGKQKIGYTLICIYKCVDGHIWQCEC